MSRQIISRRNGGVSLVYAHKITIKVQGNTIVLCARKKETSPKRGDRGVVGEWSKGSRNRLLSLLNRMEFGVVQFLTLTFHRNMADAEEGKKRLRAFTRVLRAKKGIAAGIWRQERQERGAIHYHLMLFDCVELEDAYVKGLWVKCSGEPEDDHDHYLYGAQAEKSVYAGTDDGGLVVSYFSKYVAKEAKNDGYKNGRVWGQWGCNKKLAAAYEKEIDVAAYASTLRGLLSCGGRIFDNDSALGCKLYLGSVGNAAKIQSDSDLVDLLDILRKSRKQAG